MNNRYRLAGTWSRWDDQGMEETLFPGRAVTLGAAVGRVPSELSFPLPARGPVRHARGYAAFASYATAHGADPQQLAGDLPDLVEFLASHPDLLGSAVLLQSATIFLGNAIIAAHSYASWQLTDQPEIAGPAMNIVMAPTTRDVIMVRGSGRRLLATLAGWPQARRDEQEFERLGDVLEEPLQLPDRPFVRPRWESVTYYDVNGDPIPYGSRYPDGPPEDAYSRVSHPERFAPLRFVVDALVDYLQENYQVTVHVSADDNGDRMIEFSPSTGASMVMIMSTDSVVVTAGALFRNSFPDCSCDACDETADTAADALQDAVLGIAGGGLGEHYPVGARRWTHVRLQTPTGTSAGGGGADGSFTAERDRAIRAKLDPLVDGRWPAWSLRH